MRKLMTFLAGLLLSTVVFANEGPAVAQGTEQYDWQTCVNEKTEVCMNDCETSEDINCSEQCQDMAKDKCQSAGITAPQE